MLRYKQNGNKLQKELDFVNQLHRHNELLDKIWHHPEYRWYLWSLMLYVFSLIYLASR
jgi:hypothetical protein